MSQLKSTTFAILSIVAIATVSSPMAAQPGPQGPGPGTMRSGPRGPMAEQMTPQMPDGMRGMMGQGGMMGMMGMVDHVDGRLAFLKTELGITDAQLPQWNAFGDALRANVQRMSDMRNSMMQGGTTSQSGAPISAPDRLDRMEKMLTGMIEAVKATKSVLVPLYAVLSDEQKKMADQLIHGPMGMGRM